MPSLKPFSIRAYTKHTRSHYHDFHQLVLPLQGSIKIKVGDFEGLVNVGDCVVIKSKQRHDFSANENARFMVVDSHKLPENILNVTNQKFVINNSLLSYIQFIEKQLNAQTNSETESKMFELFYQLLSHQSLSIVRDKRIEQVLTAISNDVSLDHSIESLAKLAFLSSTQFKKVFKASMGSTVLQYITQVRMEKAKALLTHTDTPIHIVAEKVGYQNPSAFSRKFKAVFGVSPNELTA